jgi:hypothetical protein
MSNQEHEPHVPGNKGPTDSPTAAWAGNDGQQLDKANWELTLGSECDYALTQ